MQNIPFVKVSRRDCYDEEIARNYAAHVLAEDEEYRKNRDGVTIAPSSIISVIASGTTVVTMSHAHIDAYSIEVMHHEEAKFREATNLITGRRLLPAHNGGEEENGLLSGLELERF